MKDETSDFDELKSLVYAEAEKKLIWATDVYLDRLVYELSIIHKQGFTDYFLLYKRLIDIINSFGLIRSPGRNTAPGSLVNYCLDITKIDPVKEGLIFERFLLPDQTKLPDIDTDIPAGYQDLIIETLKKQYPQYDTSYLVFEQNSDRQNREVIYNGISYKKHSCGVIIRQNQEIHATFSVDGRKYCILHETDQSLYEEKIDILELPYLNKLQNIVDEIGDAYHPYKLSLQDEDVFALFAEGALQDVFQFNGPTLRRVAKSFKPVSVRDLALVQAVFRPGSMQYIAAIVRNKRSLGAESDLSLGPVSDILRESYGVLVYQETFLLLMQEISGMSFSESEKWRRRIMRDKSGVELSLLREHLMLNCRRYNYSLPSEIEDFVEMIVGMLPLTFPKAHALSYAMVGYWGAYYKAHFPEVFTKVFG